MSISFHCESCKNKIKAPDGAGGKWGNCPYCHHRCYIPLPRSEDEEELKLAPINELEESRVDDLMRETHSLTQNILHQTAVPEEALSTERTADEKSVIKTVIIYLRQMADGELGQAEKTFKKLKADKKVALRLLASMARAERPEPELSDLPENVLQGLIRDAGNKLS